MSSCCGNKEETCGGGGRQKSSSSPPSASSRVSGGLDGISRIRVEFAVNVSNQDDLNRVEAALKSKGVNLVSSDVSEKMIQFDLPVSCQDHARDEAQTTTRVHGCMDNAHSLQRFIEDQTGLLTVVKGLGERNSVVAELRPPDGGGKNDEATSSSSNTVMGVVRLSQLADLKCYADGSLDGLGGGGDGRRRYSLAIHEFGDLAGERYENIGQPMVPIQEMPMDKLDGDSFVVSGRLLENCDVASMIGRSIALSEQPIGEGVGGEDAGGKGQVLSAGVIARASTIGRNKKQICSCSGKTLWQERMDNRQTNKPP